MSADLGGAASADLGGAVSADTADTADTTAFFVPPRVCVLLLNWDFPVPLSFLSPSLYKYLFVCFRLPPCLALYVSGL